MSLARCSSISPRVRVARAPAARTRATHARVPVRARSVAVAALDGEEVYEEDVDYSGNLCMFLDSASEEEWARWLPSGIFTGVTTNPIILERDNRACTVATLTELAKQALEYDAVQEIWGASNPRHYKRWRDAEKESLAIPIKGTSGNKVCPICYTKDESDIHGSQSRTTPETWPSVPRDLAL